MKILRLLTVLVTFLAALLIDAGADTLKFDSAVGPADSGPRRGATMTEVEGQFGPPARRKGPIGDPPITVWTYPGFTVYYEHNLVLHVTTRR